MGERYVDVGKVRSRSGPLRSVRAPAHPARPQPPLTASVHGLHSQPPPTSRPPSPSSVVLRLEIGSRGSAGTRRWASTSPAGTLRDPRRHPGGRHQPTSTDTATLPSARRSRQAGSPSARRATERAHRAEHPAGPPPPSSSTRGVLPVLFPRPLAYGREHAAYPDSLPPPP